MKNLHRIFLAINIPEDLKKEISRYQDYWPELPARWTNPENLHVTLVFLGNVNDQEVVEVCAAVTDVARKHEQFVLHFNRIGFGPDDARPGVPPRMVWLKGEKSPELGGLQQDLENVLYDAGNDNCRKDGERSFAPHVTLARINQGEIRTMEQEEVPSVAEDVSFSFLAESVEVMESELRRGGSVYTVLEMVKLGEQ